MKQKDLILIIAVAVVAGVFSVVLAKFLFATPGDRQQKVEVVDAISTDFPAPDTKYFNTSSINPTRLIQIAQNSNQAPFKSSSN